MNRLMKQNLVTNAGALLVGLVLTTWSIAIGAFLMGLGTMGLVQTLADSKKTFRRADTAVSPVIGVILMVAITVVLAAIVFVLVSQLSEGTEKAPDLALNGQRETNGTYNYTVISVDAELPWGDLLVGPGATCMGYPTGEFVEAGDYFLCDTEAITVVHRPTHQVIYSHS